jgi:hypothetical protein
MWFRVSKKSPSIKLVVAPVAYDAQTDPATRLKGGEAGFALLKDEKRGSGWAWRGCTETVDAMRVSLFPCSLVGVSTMHGCMHACMQ